MKPEKPYHHGNLKDELLDAAVELIARGGTRSFTLREVARRAGVSHNAPYRHFQDKDELIAAVAAQGFGRLTKAMQQSAARGKNPLERWKLCGQGYLTFALRWPQHFNVMFGEDIKPGSYPDCDREGGAAFATLLGFVTDAQAAGAFATGDPMPAAVASWAMVHGLARLAVDKRLPMKPSQAVAFYSGFISNALASGLGPVNRPTAQDAPQTARSRGR